MVAVNRRSASGFSFIELIVVITIMGILALVVGPKLFTWVKKASFNSAKTMLNNFDVAIEAFHSDTRTYPVMLNDLISKPMEAKIAAKWDGPYMKKDDIPEDPWANEYVYRKNPSGSAHPYELFSYGPKGQEASEGDWLSVWKS
ncbi:type II secretion system major pseudopilin GspG [bacterium]|jgi:general secretion pathway protein G|nr:type II secretion system major pseudopilin GspG [bacterium]MBT3903665.1 type II secretion system major pseudopilin GspG [bacterium]MBT4577646.1 type II secretion system major pseudopilin GspG [bacterium]MBT5346164.1 type II secretion system major pseudopilin GspG [bacterium]MBT6131222.1 type II secretion system major pseudopilin GspG [bacterium]